MKAFTFLDNDALQLLRVNICRRDAMTMLFAEFQQKAIRLATCLARTNGQHVGCLSFFPYSFRDMLPWMMRPQ